MEEGPDPDVKPQTVTRGAAGVTPAPGVHSIAKSRGRYFALGGGRIYPTKSALPRFTFLFESRRFAPANQSFASTAALDESKVRRSAVKRTALEVAYSFAHNIMD